MLCASLQYDEQEAHERYVVFYEDVLPEFQSVGTVVQFKVCLIFLIKKLYLYSATKIMLLLAKGTLIRATKCPNSSRNIAAKQVEK